MFSNEKNMPIFTVIIPTYNREKLIANAINSVLNQTFHDFELLVVDDGSVDNTRQVIEQIRDDRLKYIYKKNGGQNSALNVGIRNATGIYVAFLDSDDTWFPEKLQKIYEKYQSDSKISVVYHLTGLCGKNGDINAVNDDKLEGYIYKDVLHQEYLSSQISLSCKKSCFDVIGLYDENFVMFQDDDICFQLARNFKVGLVKEILSLIGGEASNRVTANIHRTVCDYSRLIEKYKDDILKYCGNSKIAEMYYKLAVYYGKDNNMKKARDTFLVVKQYDNGNKYNRIKLEVNLLVYKITKPFILIKSKLWRIYSQGKKKNG